MSRRFIGAVLGAASALATVVSCSDSIPGTAQYAPDDPRPGSALVRVSDLQALVLSTTDLGALLNAPDLTSLNLPAVRTLPPGVLSDPACGPAMQSGWLATYRVSGMLGARGLAAQDQHENRVEQTVAAFRDPTAARALASAVIKDWKTCIERSVTETAEGYTARWMGFGPSRADGVDVLLIRREGGRGYACSRAIAAASNVTADVSVCEPDETVVTGQAARIVTAILARIHG